MPTSPTTPRGHDQEPKSFMPKVPIELDAPKDRQFTYEELSQCDGTNAEKSTLVAIKGTVFDVSRNSAYAPGGSYSVFAGKDPSRALAQSSLKPADCVPEWEDLEDQHKTVLSEWFTFFSKRYNIVGTVRDDKKEGLKL